MCSVQTDEDMMHALTMGFIVETEFGSRWRLGPDGHVECKWGTGEWQRQRLVPLPCKVVAQQGVVLDG